MRAKQVLAGMSMEARNGRNHMSRIGMIAGIALVAAFSASSAFAQQPQTQRLSGTIEKINGNMVLVKTSQGEATVALADKALIVDVHKASLADIKEGSYIGSGAVPQADGTQKAVEVHIFAESQRGTGDGHRPGWYGAQNGTMTNGAVEPTGAVLASAGGGEPSFIVKYKEGDKRIVVPANAHIVRYEVGSRADVKAGVQ